MLNMRLSSPVSLAGAVALVCAAVTLTGCLDKPKIEDRWTRLDVATSNLTPHQTLPAGTQQAITVRTNVTYRAVLTGFAVAELRVADSLGAAAAAIAPDAPRVEMARNIDAILASSRSLGRATRAVTGWDHLIQPIDFAFNATPPVDSSGASRVFLLCYLGSGDEMEQANGQDSLVITPFISDEQQVLPVGMELYIGAP